jgi:nitrogen fixation NifU-like protein
MSSLYTDLIQHADRYPQHRRELADATHSFEDENPLCGDILSVQLRVEDGRIAEAGFGGRGCAISQAAMELMLERIEHQPVSSAEGLNKDVVLEELGLPSISPARLKCALLPVEVIKGALAGRRTAGDRPAGFRL